MKLYKYRDFSAPEAFNRLQRCLVEREFWCARPDTLNDPEELAWTCDYTSTPDTRPLLTELLVRACDRSRAEAQLRADAILDAGHLKNTAESDLMAMIDQCRREIGLVCFGTSPDNPVLWQRYGGGGAGVCIELEVPDNLLGQRYFRVQYVDRKVIHIDQLIRAFLDRERVSDVYALALLTKPSFWAPEAEVRFVSKQHSVSVAVDEGRIARLIVGGSLAPELLRRIKTIASDVEIVY